MTDTKNSSGSSPDIPVTAIVMTYNERRNLRACLESLAHRVQQIIVLDSFSNDETLDIAREFTQFVYQHEFVNQAKQYIWGMENCEIHHEWVVRVDADERWTKSGLDELACHVADETCNGLTVRMKIFFMGRWLRRGGMYPNLFLRAYRRSKGKMEDRWMDEHISVDGKVVQSTIDVIESNYDRQSNISLWTDKHNAYSTREAMENLIARNQLKEVETIASLSGRKTERKRWMKENAYSRAPLFLRPFIYFVYRYFFQLGFLEGREGFVFHVLHAFWYRFLVDVKVYQMERNAKLAGVGIREAIRDHWGIELEP